jgi:hypothetical protein
MPGLAREDLAVDISRVPPRSISCSYEFARLNRCAGGGFTKSSASSPGVHKCAQRIGLQQA